MEVTKNVILDLLPMYVADEVSDDTKELVKNYLKSDPELEKIAMESQSGFENDVDIPIKKEDKLEAYMKVKRLQIIRSMVFAGIAAALFLAMMAAVTVLT